MLYKKLFILVLTLMATSYANGFFDFDLKGHIVNGQPAARDQFPFYALVKMILTNGRHGYCGGTVINNQWILTAAHCARLRAFTIDRFEIHLGALNITDLTEEGRIVVTAKQSFIHQKYSPSKRRNDIALLKLQEPLQFNSHIQAVHLIQNATLETGTRLAAIGFGRLNATSSQILHFAEFVPVSLRECAKTFAFPLNDRQDVICAKRTNLASSCGYNGGPLIAYKNRVPTLIGGIGLGYSSGCQRGWPTGFTNIFRFLPWIQQTIASN